MFLKFKYEQKHQQNIRNHPDGGGCRKFSAFTLESVYRTNMFIFWEMTGSQSQEMLFGKD